MSLIRPFLRSVQHVRSPHMPPDLDEDAFVVWCQDAYPDKRGRLRTLHPEANEDALVAAVERGRRLHDVAVAAPVAGVTRDASVEEIGSALQREVPGLSARAYAHAAQTMVSYFMTYDSWM